MTYILAAVFTGLIAASAAAGTATSPTPAETTGAASSTDAADQVNRGDLYASCIIYQNAKWKAGFGGALSSFTAAQRTALAPFNFTAMQQECACTVTAAFDSLSQSTIAAYNAAYQAKGDGITLGTAQAIADFKKAGMADKRIACASKAMDSSGYLKKLTELSK